MAGKAFRLLAGGVIAACLAAGDDLTGAHGDARTVLLHSARNNSFGERVLRERHHHRIQALPDADIDGGCQIGSVTRAGTPGLSEYRLFLRLPAAAVWPAVEIRYAVMLWLKKI